MLDVLSIRNLDVLSQFELLTGEKGLSKGVSNVVILDYEGLAENYYGFHKGDFVLTNLMFAKEAPERIYRSFHYLIELGVSAIAVKTVIFSEIPEDVISLCENNDIPLFVFKDCFMEDVIIAITDQIRASSNLTYYEKLVTPFIEETDLTPNVLELLDAMSYSIHEGFITCAYLRDKKEKDDFAIQRVIHKLQLQYPTDATPLRIIKYQNGILLFYTYSSKEESAISQKWLRLITSLSLSLEQYYLGISDLLLPMLKIHVAIQRSVFACRNSIAKQTKEGHYSELGYTNFLYPLKQNTYIGEYLQELIQKLEPSVSSFDDFENTATYITLKTCVEKDFDMDQVGEALFQHQNTIRYRLKKAKELLHIEDESIFRMVVLFLVS